MFQIDQNCGEGSIAIKGTQRLAVWAVRYRLHTLIRCSYHSSAIVNLSGDLLSILLPILQEDKIDFFIVKGHNYAKSEAKQQVILHAQSVGEK